MNLLFRRGLKYIFLALFPVTLVVISFSYDGLNLWLGSEFAEQGVRVLQLLAIGVFINSLAQVPFVLLQGAGRPDITAKLHLVELPLYLPLVFLLISRYNIEGAALAWVIRMGFDALLLFLSVLWILPVGRPRLSWRAVAVAGSVVFVFIFAMASTGVMIKGVFLTLVLLIFALISWFFFFSRDERALAQKIFRIRVTTGRATAD